MPVNAVGSRRGGSWPSQTIIRIASHGAKQVVSRLKSEVAETGVVSVTSIQPKGRAAYPKLNVIVSLESQGKAH